METASLRHRWWFVTAAMAVAAACAVSAASADGRRSTGDDGGGGVARPQLPRQFIVSTGTTIPFPDSDPVAQSGAIYFDADAGQLRVDNFWLGTQRTLIVDVRRQRAHVINGGECVTSSVTGELLPVTLPAAAARDHDVHSVRGVSVDRFHHVMKDESDLVDADYFFRKANVSVTAADASADDYWIPWRITTRRHQRQEMIAAPDRPNPNWRFFGEEVSDAIVRFYGSDRRALARVTRGVTVTVDFYNFVPTAPDSSVFEAPEALCAEPPTSAYSEDVDLLRVQRDMIEMSFNGEEGRRLMHDLWGPRDHSHELPSAAAGGDKKKKQPPTAGKDDL